MTLSLAGGKGTSSYPTLKCKGVWTRIGRTADGYDVFQEKIVNEPGATCIDGVAAVYLDDDKLVLGWFASFEGTPSLASAVLERGAK
jgi:hypothetical protein